MDIKLSLRANVNNFAMIFTYKHVLRHILLIFLEYNSMSRRFREHMVSLCLTFSESSNCFQIRRNVL